MAFDNFQSIISKGAVKTKTGQPTPPATAPTSGGFSNFKKKVGLPVDKAAVPTPATQTPTPAPTPTITPSPSSAFIRDTSLEMGSADSTHAIPPASPVSTPSAPVKIQSSAPQVTKPSGSVNGAPPSVLRLDNQAPQADQTFISAAPEDNRPADTALASIGRTILPWHSIQKELGIAQEQRKPAPMSEYDIVKAAGTAQTKYMMEKNPAEIDPGLYFNRGQSFGNNLDAVQRYQDANKGYKGDIDVTDLPEPVTIKQKIAETLGQISTMSFAEPLIGEAVGGFVSKIPGGTKVLDKIAEMSVPKAIAQASDVSSKFGAFKGAIDATVDVVKANAVSYATAIVKSAGIGSIFGLITENKKTVAENVLQTAGTFAGFTAITYPIAAFFRPVLQQAGKMEFTPNQGNVLNDPTVTQEPIAKTLWFTNPKDETQIMKVTANGVQFVPKDSAAVVSGGADAAHPTVLTKLDVEAFQSKPSLYEQLKTFVSGEKPTVTEIPFTVKDNMPVQEADAFTGTTPMEHPSVDKTSSELRNEIQTITSKMNETTNPMELQALQDQAAPLVSALNQFHGTAGQSSLVVNDANGARIGGISTVEYSDGQYAAKIDASTPSHGVTTSFNDSKLYPTEKAAISAAKNELTSWASDALKTAEDPADIKALETITSKVKGLQSQVSNLSSQVAEQGKIILQDNDLHNRILFELENAQAGQRIAVPNIDTAGYTFSRQASTFPKWIPEDLRRKPLLDAVKDHILNGTMPTKVRERRLYDVVAQEMRAMDEVVNDQKFVEQQRQNVIVPFYSDAENAANLAKFDQEYAKLKAGNQPEASQPASPQEGGTSVQAVGKPIQTKKEVSAPKELFHGGTSKFEKFDPTKYGSGEGSGLFGKGAYLTDSPKVAEFYAKKAAMKGQVESYKPTGVFGTEEPVYKAGAEEEANKIKTVNKFIANGDFYDAAKEPVNPEFEQAIVDSLVKSGAMKPSFATEEVAHYLDYARKNSAQINNFRGELPYLIDQLAISDQTRAKLLADISDYLKAKGFRWSPFNKAWQRILTDQAVRDAQKIAGAGKELTPSEIQAKADALPVYTGGGDNADIGVFQDGTPVELGSMQNIKPIEMPEMVRMARELTGAIPNVKAKMGRKLGYFSPGQGQIYLKADQFARGNEAAVAKLLAHEIGHLVDWLPDKTMSRGNLLGRIHSLRQFMKSTFGGSEVGLFGKQNVDLPKLRNDAFKGVLKRSGYTYGEYITTKAIRDELKPQIKALYDQLLEETGAIKNETIKKELTDVSEYWRPYDKEKSDARFIAYRNNPKELYADAISVLFNSPGTLEKMAPTFYKEFFAALDAKPEVKASFFETQELLNGSSEAIFKARKEDIRKGFERAEDLQADFAAKKKLKKLAFWETLRQQLDDVNYPILKKQAEAEARGAEFGDDNNPKFVLQEHSLTDNENFLLVEDIDKNVVKPIEAAGMTIEDMGEYLLLRRIQGDRADIANPFGFNQKTAGAQLEHLKNAVGEKNFELLATAAQHFHDLVFKSVEEAVRVGSYNKERFETTIKPNKDTYATFQVVDYLQDYVPATVKAQVGTLKEVANPFVSTILKTVALNRLNALQRAKNATLDMLRQNFPDEIAETKRITSDGKLSIFKPAKDKGSIEVMVDGKMQSFDVDPYIAQSFKHDNTGTLAQVIHVVLGIPNNKLFKPLFTTFNLGFSIFNTQRDFRDTYKNLPRETTVASLLKAYIKALPSSVKYAKGQLDEFTRSLVESKAINAPVNDFNFDEREDQFGRVLEKYGLVQKEDVFANKTAEQIRKIVLRPLEQLLQGVKFVGNVIEISGKIAGARERIRLGESGAALAHNLRNFTSTPNYRTKGLSTSMTNDIFLFSNINKEGWKRAYRMGTDPKTRSGYWWKTVKIDLLPTIIQWIAGAGLAGVALKKFYDKVSEYDKTNYAIIPLGYYDKEGGFSLPFGSSEGKEAVYARMPHDETGRLLSAVLWKMMNFAKDRDTNNLSQIFAFGAGQIPNITPAITIPAQWAAYLSGQNPYDAFRGRNVIDDTTFKAGGGAALKQMVKWTLNGTGLTKFASYDTSKQTGIETFMQLAPGVSTAIRVSNYGEQEQLNKIGQKQASIDAQKTLDDRELVNKYVDIARREKTSIFNATKYKNAIVKEGLGGHFPKSKEEATYANNLMTKFTRALKAGKNDDPRVAAVISATSNNQKREILSAIKADMTKEEWGKFRNGLVKDKIATPELLFNLK